MGIPISLDGERFCVSPDTRLPMWYWQRSQLDVDRGPYENPEAVLTAVGSKEVAYPERFGRPLLPFQREEAYELVRLWPKPLEDSHPARHCQRAHTHKPDKSDYMQVYGRYHARLVHYRYVKSTMELNEPHHDILWDLVSIFIRRLFDHAGAPWEGETHDLKALLVEVEGRWAELAGAGVPCPVEFKLDDVSKTKAFSERLQLSGENYVGCQAIIGFETETWVPNGHYERAKALAELLKLNLL
ncbi:hypothetical protein C8Q73DRAFT_667191 [Cubamyces lactineus]|nr:hypothetical protein C8Q73DRAFT_667191 [Cubamyces lactineus]